MGAEYSNLNKSNINYHTAALRQSSHVKHLWAKLHQKHSWIHGCVAALASSIQLFWTALCGIITNAAREGKYH